MKYRAEIDGLRALAVIPVILYHAGFEVFSGGYIGVDVFFVISGYLITTILFEDIANNRFSLLNFYERRARRILPALFFHIAILTLLGVFLLPPHALKDLGQSIVATSIFISNVFFYIETDYFNNFAELAPLIHTWSLSVEEQFYILFPLLLLLVRKESKQLLWLTLSVLSVASLIGSQYLLATDPVMSFYFLFTRFWELGVGCGLAVYGCRKERKGSFIAMNLAIMGAILIIVPMLTYTKETPFPGLLAIPPVLGTFLLLQFSQAECFIGRILTLNLFTKIGLLSYSWYLSHHIIFALSRNGGVALQSLSEKIIAILISFLMALFSYFIVERPLRRINCKRSSYFACSILMMIAFVSIGLFIHDSNGLKDWKLSSLNDEQSKLIIDTHNEIRRRKAAWSNLLEDEKNLFTATTTDKKLLILGDSKSEDLYISLVMATHAKNIQARRLTLKQFNMHHPENSDRNSNAPLHRVVESQLFRDADEIVLTSTWSPLDKNGVVEFVKFIVEKGKRVSIVSTSNFSDIASLSYVIAKRQIAHAQLGSFFFKNIRNDHRRLYLKLKEMIENEKLPVRLLEKLSVFCNLEEQKCNLRDESNWYIYDSGHVTVEGAQHLGVYAAQHWFQ